MSDNGYQIIEPEILSKWMGTVVHEGMLFSLLSWLVDQLIKTADVKFSNIEIAVIPVEYVDKYPAIGIHYKNMNDEDISSYIEEKIEFMLKNKTILDYVSWCLDKPYSWQNEYKKFMELEN